MINYTQGNVSDLEKEWSVTIRELGRARPREGDHQPTDGGAPLVRISHLAMTADRGEDLGQETSLSGQRGILDRIRI